METIMKTMMTVLVLVVMGGCMAEDPAYEGVASQESAVEGTPTEATPTEGTSTPSDDDLLMDQLHDRCVSECYGTWTTCMFRCVAHHGRENYQNCDDLECASDHAIARGCEMNCDMIWPTHGHGGGRGGIDPLPGTL
jgi:hypothetical protein